MRVLEINSNSRLKFLMGEGRNNNSSFNLFKFALHCAFNPGLNHLQIQIFVYGRSPILHLKTVVKPRNPVAPYLVHLLVFKTLTPSHHYTIHQPLKPDAFVSFEYTTS